MMLQITMSSLFSILSDIKMPILPTLCILEKLLYHGGDGSEHDTTVFYMLSVIENE